MAAPNDPSASPDHSQGLHLGQFASQAPSPPASPSPDSEEGPTLFIKKAAAQTAADMDRPLVVPAGASALPPKDMLGVVSYCYAKGVCSSEEIEERMLEETALRTATGDAVPDAQAIRRFRRLNRDAIVATLTRFYTWARRRGQAAPPPAAAPVTANAAADETGTVTKARQDATAKVDEAVLLDSATNDE